MNTIDPTNPIPSPAQVRQSSIWSRTNVKATKEALELKIIECDTLITVANERAEYIAGLEEHIGAQNQTMNEMSATLIKLAQSEPGGFNTVEEQDRYRQEQTEVD